MAKQKSKNDISKTAGRVLGPVQIVDGRSIDRIHVNDQSITRCCVTNEKNQTLDESRNRTMGTKYRIPYALYRQSFYISAHDAEKTGFTEADLAHLKESFVHMFENDHSSSRGEMVIRGVYLFKHESKHGNAPAHRILSRVKVQKKDGIDTVTSFEDYDVTVDRENLPAGVTLEEIDWDVPTPADSDKVIENRYEGVLLYDVTNGNPNGDPDDNGRPRQCPITGKGIVTDVCIKRKIRNYILSRYEGPGMAIFYQEGVVLNRLISDPYETDEETKKAFKAKDKNAQNMARKVLCKRFFDIRTFGSVLSTE